MMRTRATLKSGFKSGLVLLVLAAAGWMPAGAAEVDQAAVRSVLQGRCFQCHGPERQKSGLRLDTVAGLEEGAAVVAANKPDESELLRRVTLPADDPDVMPPKGDPLAEDDVNLLRAWIAAGAPTDQWEAAGTSDEAATEAAFEPFAVVQDDGGGGIDVPALFADDRLAKLADGVPAPDEAALARLKESGALAMPLDQDTPLLRVDFQYADEADPKAYLKQLEPVADQVTWLNLAGADVTDEHLAHVAKLKHLTSLHLEKTGVTDAGLKHLAGLEHLEYLNLYGTKVSDAGLEHLGSLKNLKRLYLWQTDVTAEGAKTLKEQVPDVVVNRGWQAQAKNETAEEDAAAKEAAEETAPADEEKDTAPEEPKKAEAPETAQPDEAPAEEGKEAAPDEEAEKAEAPEKAQPEEAPVDEEEEPTPEDAGEDKPDQEEPSGDKAGGVVAQADEA